MATYQYRCNSCKKDLIVQRGISEKDPGYECKACKIPLTKVYSIGAVTFNGSGFYSKDK